MKLGIIGCGTIVATYLQALSQPDMPLTVAALYDLDPENMQKYAAPGMLLCNSLEQLLASDVQCVVVSTPLHTHTRIAAQCLRAGKHVLMEKPATLELQELEQLFSMAREQHRVFHVSFHAAFGVDIEWYLQHSKTLETALQPENIRLMECGFFDPYMPDGVILEDRKALGGSCVDSGVNILSVCSRLTELSGLHLLQHNAQQQENIVCRSESLYEGNNRQLIMRTGWDRGINHKSTLLHFHGIEDRLLLDHSDQAVRLLHPDGTEQLLFRETEKPRMVNQYILAFRQFALLINQPSCDTQQQAMDIHRLLLQAVSS
ncbi:MAG: Gfo/Idh/MocA family oxidoreductase [Ruminococcaceae bacterium]|nr:Gfo/Idh/MocA family oxidoreductase [Oscillospiraceae bacterium]